MHRFFVPNQTLLDGQTVELDGFAHQLHNVLRLQAGDKILLLDSTGCEAVAELLTLTRAHAAVAVLAIEPCKSEPQIHLTLYQCSLKQDKFEWLLQKGSELGVPRFVPVISTRSVARPAEALHRKYDRWRAIIREAAEQSGRGRLPVLESVMSWSAAVHSLEGVGFLPWEEARGGIGLGNTVQAALAAAPSAPAGRRRISILIGPEGGITGEEAQQAQSAGWQVAGLGPRVLRAETAALAAVSIVLDRSGELAAAAPIQS